MLCCLAALAQPTNPPPRWPPLAEVLKKWDSLTVEDVEKAAERGELTAQHYLGYSYCEGRRVASNPEKGIDWYTRAGEGGYMPSFNNLSVLYQNGRVVPRDAAARFRYIFRAAEGGYVPAFRIVGMSYRAGEGVRQDFQAGIRWLQRSAEAGDALAMVELGRSHLYGWGTPVSHVEAKSLFQKAAAAGEVLGELNLGFLFKETREFPEAFRFFLHAAERGNSEAMHQLFHCYWCGIGVGTNVASAKTWLIKAAEAGNSEAQYEVAETFFNAPWRQEAANPQGEKYLFQALKWYEKAAQQQHRMAQWKLASCYLTGHGTEINEERAVEWLRTAADGGYWPALRDLAELYASGVGEPRNSGETPMRIWQKLATISNYEPPGYRVQADAFKNILFRYQLALGTPKDLVAASEWYCRAALAGVEGFPLTDPLVKPPVQQFRYSMSGAYDRHVSLRSGHIALLGDDFLPVLSLYLKAAAGDAVARKRIAAMYERGDKAPQDRERAEVWSLLAAEKASDAEVSNPEAGSRKLLQELRSQLSAVATRMASNSNGE